MLSTGLSLAAVARRAFLATGLVAGLAALAACAPAAGPQATGAPGPSVDLGAPVRVALLVPLGSGDPGRDEIGRSLVNAARLAQADLAGVALDIEVYETAGTTSGGAAAARRAVDDGAQIIVGPLFSTATAGARSAAQAAGLPVLSFSNNASVAGGNVYLLGLTFENTADRVVSYAMGRGLSNIAVVYPNGLEGETARNAVAAATRQRGGTLVAQQGYDLSRQAIQAASGPIARTLQGAGANAVVLADGPTGGLGFIAEGLRDQGLGAGATQFLGLQRWDISAEVLSQDSLQGSWFAAPDPGVRGAFEGRYRNAYGGPPHEIAGLAYDGIAAVGAMVREARAGGVATPFAEGRITQPAGFAGVYGSFRFLPNGLNQRNLAIMEVRGGSAAVVDRAPRAFVPLVN